MKINDLREMYKGKDELILLDDAFTKHPLLNLLSFIKTEDELLVYDMVLGRYDSVNGINRAEHKALDKRCQIYGMHDLVKKLIDTLLYGGDKFWSTEGILKRCLDSAEGYKLPFNKDSYANSIHLDVVTTVDLLFSNIVKKVQGANTIICSSEMYELLVNTCRLLGKEKIVTVGAIDYVNYLGCNLVDIGDIDIFKHEKDIKYSSTEKFLKSIGGAIVVNLGEEGLHYSVPSQAFNVYPSELSEDKELIPQGSVGLRTLLVANSSNMKIVLL
ncbi:hypothetical protein D3C81_09640 [compost metagenome]